MGTLEVFLDGEKNKVWSLPGKIDVDPNKIIVLNTAKIQTIKFFFDERGNSLPMSTMTLLRADCLTPIQLS